MDLANANPEPRDPGHHGGARPATGLCSSPGHQQPHDTAVDSGHQNAVAGGNGPAPCVGRVAVLALALAASLTAEVRVDRPHEWYQPEASHHGKHAILGAIVAPFAYLGAAAATDSHLERIAWTGATGLTLGVAYEVQRGSDGSAYIDPVDAAWVGAGALLTGALIDLTGQAISASASRDSASVGFAWRF